MSFFNISSITIIILSFFITSENIIKTTSLKTYLPLKTIEITGKIKETEESITLKFDSNNKSITIKQEDNETTKKRQNAEIWQQLFFQTTNPKQSNPLIDTLKSFKIDFSKKMLSTTKPKGKLIYIIGKNKTEEQLPFISIYKNTFLPFEISLNNKQIFFYDYKKSPYPLTFPGKIIVKEQNKTTTFIFYRKEFQEKQWEKQQ